MFKTVILDLVQHLRLLKPLRSILFPSSGEHDTRKAYSVGDLGRATLK
jgi:hypothetical protein